MKNHEECIDQLKELLKGTHMGIEIMKDLKEKLQSPELKKEMNEVLEKFQHHMELLQRQIHLLQEEEEDVSGIMETISILFNKMKYLTLDGDEEILAQALDAIEMGQKALDLFEQRHFIMSEALQKDFLMIKDDYESIYHNLHKRLLLLQ